MCVLYKIRNVKSNTKLTLAPVINFRDFHTMSTNCEFNISQAIKDRKVKVTINEHSEKPIYMNLSEGNYIEHHNDYFSNMYYIEEEKRGFFPEENHIVSGRYEVEIQKDEEKDITFVCSLEENIEELDAKVIIDAEIKRLTELVYDTKLTGEGPKIAGERLVRPKVDKQFIKDLVVATDAFIINRPAFGLHSIIAGYPWFLDWGRDTAIAYEGCILLTKRFKIAKEILLLMIRDIKFGLVPNGYSGFDDRPLYNSVDSSLLLFEQVHKYIRYTGDTKFVKDNLYVILRKIIKQYQSGIDLDDNNIYLDTDGLISSGTPSTQNTWMDAKYADYAITPRNGKAVEINALWYNGLMIMSELAKQFEKKADAQKYIEMAEKCKESFTKSFYNRKRKCLYDVIGDKKIRPNQLFALSLSHPVIDPDSDIAKEMIETVTKKLLTKYGLKTLAKGEEGYVDTYEGDNFRRDVSYHQGIVWPWLLGLYYDSLKNIIKAKKNKEQKKEFQDKLDKFIEETRNTFLKALYEDDCVGNISEIYDAKLPQLPKGAFAQAWSVGEILKIILEN